MSLEIALQSTIFHRYVLLVGGTLILAGGVLSLLKWGLKKNVASVFRTYRAWLIMVPLFFGSLFAGRVVAIIFFGLLALGGFKEFAKATGLYRDWWMTGAVYVAIIVVFTTTFVPDPNDGEAGWYGLFMTLPVFAIAFFLMIPILRDRCAGQLQTVSLAIVGFVYIGWMFGHLAFLVNSPHAYGYLLYLVFAVEVNDVAAFICGKLFGRHKLRPNTSPNKTWEGSLGAMGVSLLLPWLLHFSFPHFGTLQLILTGFIVGIGGQLGDLSLSFIKRDIGVKDMGSSIPGHGGILDRIDSLIYTAPLFLHMVDYFYKHW